MNRYRLLLCSSALLALFGCTQSDESVSVASEQVGSEQIVSQQTTAELWQRSCALCHVDGNAGAPRIGNQREWGPRLSKGSDVLLRNTLEGINQMPPLGYCMACERADFSALISFMTDGLRSNAAANSAARREEGSAQ